MGRQEARNHARLVEKKCMSLLKLVGKPGKKSQFDVIQIKRLENELINLGAMRRPTKWEKFKGRLKATFKWR